MIGSAIVAFGGTPAVIISAIAVGRNISTVSGITLCNKVKLDECKKDCKEKDEDEKCR